MSKYDHIDFTAPQGVRENMRRGLELHQDDVTGDGLEPETVAWARRIAAGESVSPERARMGNRFFGRNERFADEPKDSPAWASWQLWGGAAGRGWFSSLVEQMDAADTADKSSAFTSPSPDTLTETDRARWQATYDAVFAETGDGTKAELAAWGAVRKAYVLRMAGKSVKGGAVVGGWGMLFTDERNLDLDDQYFDSDTELLLEYYENAPLWMEHGQDDRYGALPIGKRASVKVYPHGIWVEHELDPEHPRYDETLKAIERGDLSYSSDSIGHYARSGYEPETGRLGTWFLAGWSLTETPAEPALGAVTLREFAESVKSAGKAARDAHAASGNDSATEAQREARSMDEIVNGLAEFFGIDADGAAVKSSLEALVAKMNAPEEDVPEDEQKADMPDMAQLAMALGLGEGATPDDLRARLQQLLSMLEPQAAPDGMESAGVPVPVQAKSFNFAGMAAAFEAAVKSAPAIPSDLPKHTQNGEREPGVKRVNYNRGAKLPGLADLVLGLVGKKSESAMKAMGYSIGSNGGYFLRQEVANEIIELFRAQTVVTQLGATVVPMAGIESLTYRKQLTGASAGYRGEAQAITQSEPTFGVVNLQLKELVAATRINRRLLKNSAENLEAMIRNDLQLAINLRGDKAALVGTGGIANDSYSTGAEPRGVRYTTGVTSTALATNGAVPSIDDFVDAWGRIEDANVPVSGSWGIALSPRTKRTLENITDTTGQLLDVARWSQGYKYLPTTQISNTETVGSSTDCSAVYLGAWEYLIIGLGQDVEINVSEEVYRTSGEIYVEAIMMHDCAVAQPDAFEVLTGVRA